MMRQATPRELIAAKFFMKAGYLPSGASAITGNMSHESGGINLPSAFRTGRLDHGSQGLAQWRLGRLSEYEHFVQAKHPELKGNNAALWVKYGVLEYQLEFIVFELKRDYPTLDAALRKGGSVSALTARVCWEYERPSKKYAALNVRIGHALAIFNSLPQGAKTAVDTNMVAALDEQADAHAAKKQAGIAVIGAGGAISAVPAVVSAASQPSFPWWGWLIFAVVGFLIICGVCAYFAHAKAERLLRMTKTNLMIPPEMVETPEPNKPEPEPPIVAKPRPKSRRSTKRKTPGTKTTPRPRPVPKMPPAPQLEVKEPAK